MRCGRIVLIMQARMGSTRLPGKSLMPLAGHPLLERIIQRVKRCRKVDAIVLATTEKKEDDALCAIAEMNGIEVFRGSENDLLDRYYRAALRFNADFVVRLPADNPVVEPAEIDRIVEHHLASSDDFSSNTHNILNNKYPDGLGAEVFPIQKLREIWEIATDPRNREHPHTYFYEHPDKYRIGTIECPAEFQRPDLVLDVNTREEYDFLASIYDALYPHNPDFHVTEIIDWYDKIYKNERGRSMTTDQVLIIAEIGINHNGDVEIAKKLIAMAKQVGCDAVKFQKRTVDVVYSAETLAAPRESPWGNTTRQQKEGLEFGKREYDKIDHLCKEIGIDWFASAWDIASLDFLAQYNLKYNKIASAMLLHWDFVKRVAQERKRTFVSTGMCTMSDIDKAVQVFRNCDCPFVLMHTVSVYPCKDDECNVLMVKTLKERYSCKVGYSGHEVGILPSVLAVAYGAQAIERHITLDRAMYGSDQAASLERRGIELLVRDCRDVRGILGIGEKTYSENEKSVAKKLRYFMGNI